MNLHIINRLVANTLELADCVAAESKAELTDEPKRRTLAHTLMLSTNHQCVLLFSVDKPPMHGPTDTIAPEDSAHERIGFIEWSHGRKPLHTLCRSRYSADAHIHIRPTHTDTHTLTRGTRDSCTTSRARARNNNKNNLLVPMFSSLWYAFVRICIALASYTRIYIKRTFEFIVWQIRIHTSASICVLGSSRQNTDET